MKLIIESGSTKTDWRSVADDGKVIGFRTSGINPLLQSEDDIRSVMAKAIPEVNPQGRTVDEVFFYGAGVLSPAFAEPLVSLLATWCPLARIECETDLTAAARALFGDGSGVAVILGTGSNSCLWENGKAVSTIRTGGFILGDEGSGAVLGKMFLSDYIKGLVPEPLKSMFDKEYGLDYASIVTRVYRQEAPSRFLASFARFIMDNKENEYAAGLVRRNIRDFMERVLVRYGESRIGVVGAFGVACMEELIEIGQEYGLEFVRFVQSPADELVKYHGI
jgi:N-acetylglucosamine kinase-like BadF-type ATPase